MSTIFVSEILVSGNPLQLKREDFSNDTWDICCLHNHANLLLKIYLYKSKHFKKEVPENVSIKVFYPKLISMFHFCRYSNNDKSGLEWEKSYSQKHPQSPACIFRLGKIRGGVLRPTTLLTAQICSTKTNCISSTKVFCISSTAARICSTKTNCISSSIVFCISSTAAQICSTKKNVFLSQKYFFLPQQHRFVQPKQIVFLPQKYFVFLPQQHGFVQPKLIVFLPQ